MEDVREFALRALEVAKENMREHGALYPVAFLMCPDEVKMIDAFFSNEEEKIKVYAGVVEAAREHDACAIVTINDIFESKTEMDGYYWGKLAAEGARECIMVTVSGPAIRTWELLLPYERTAEGIVFSTPVESFDNDLHFLPGWAGTAQKPS
jgi:hypothetical protein